jgi:hypothetical protein
MFISKLEKLKLISGIMDLMATVQRLDSEIIYLKARIKTLEGKKPVVKKKSTAEQRAKQREYARRYYAKKQSEKKNVNSISITSV